MFVHCCFYSPFKVYYLLFSQEDIEKFRQEMVKKQTVSELKDSQQSPAKNVELDGIDID